jgi:hypothetical protein
LRFLPAGDLADELQVRKQRLFKLLKRSASRQAAVATEAYRRDQLAQGQQ